MFNNNQTTTIITIITYLQYRVQYTAIVLAKAAPLATSVSSSLLFQSSAATRDPTGSSDRWQWKAPSGPESLSSVEVNYDQGIRDIAWLSHRLGVILISG